MEKNIENEMETGIMKECIGILSYGLNSVKKFYSIFLGDYYRG